MSQNRRKFLSTAFLTAGTLGLGGKVLANDSAGKYDFSLPKSIEDLSPMKEGVVPITVEERKQRIAKAQSIMEKEKIDAIFLEGTVSCFYFTGMRWGQSERTFGVVIPAKYALNFNIIKDRGTKYKKIGMEERVRFFIADGVKKLATGFDIVDATPVTAGCRMYKTKAELDLMQYSSDITIKAYQAAFATIRPDMSQSEFSGNISAAFRKLGYTGGASVQVGKYSALPHGSITPQVIREGDIVMVDGGTSVEGYASDITRTIVVGKPTQRQIDVWNIELEAQNAAFAAIKIGAPCEVVDAAARAVIEKAGFKTNYKLPGLPHRTGHGIGLEGHEWTNFVKGNKTPMAVGMCFSNEPTISIPGEFGIRLEDCLYIAEDGPHYFSKQSISIEQPFG